MCVFLIGIYVHFLIPCMYDLVIFRDFCSQMIAILFHSLSFLWPQFGEAG